MSGRKKPAIAFACTACIRKDHISFTPQICLCLVGVLLVVRAILVAELLSGASFWGGSSVWEQ